MLPKLRRSSSPVRLGSLALLLVLLLAGSVRAVVIDSGDGSGNTTPPPDDFGFENVGRTDTGLSGVYLSSGWVITAGHVGARPITLLGVTYQPVAGSAAQVPNPSPPGPDLIVYRINGFPPLPAPALSNATPTVGEEISCLGRGWPREPTQTTWSATWQENPIAPLVVYRGYKRSFALPLLRRWGTNVVSVPSTVVLDTTAFELLF